MRTDTSWKFSLSRTGANLYKVVRRRAARARRMRDDIGTKGESFLLALLNPLLTLIAALALPAVVLMLALWLEDTALELESLQLKLLAWFPVVVFAIGIGMALRFNRARILAALANLLLGYVAITWLLPSLDPFEQRTLLAMLFLLLPLNHLVCHVLPDHAAVSGMRLVLLGVLALQALLFVLVAGTGWETITSLLHADVFSFVDPAEIGLSDAGFVSAVILLTLSFARLYTLTNTQRAALFVSAYCLVLVLANVTQPGTVIAFTAAGALVLAIAGFQESWNIAYLDQLTELPGRRALEEALARLEGRFAIAMVDVDHFKKFNDTYGHDVGDQVLRMVASQLQGVGGGGKAYRYGGEEFTILFPGRTAAEVMPAVDALREAIGRDTFEIRRRERRGGNESNVTTQTEGSGTISITVSAGISERVDRSIAAVEVIKAADEALYSAKHAGRNRVKIKT
ncbi:MAG: GGDEF domain-containing protein [Proteobacteria bacterium]|nr:GGDEF domain-containing protein [Pseudomonadota bacterium]